jgi:hypothetical protein
MENVILLGRGREICEYRGVALSLKRCHDGNCIPFPVHVAAKASGPTKGTDFMQLPGMRHRDGPITRHIEHVTGERCLPASPAPTSQEDKFTLTPALSMCYSYNNFGLNKTRVSMF